MAAIFQAENVRASRSLSPVVREGQRLALTLSALFLWEIRYACSELQRLAAVT